MVTYVEVRGDVVGRTRLREINNEKFDIDET